jgi:hypothetical protein
MRLGLPQGLRLVAQPHLVMRLGLLLVFLQRESLCLIHKRLEIHRWPRRWPLTIALVSCHDSLKNDGYKLSGFVWWSVNPLTGTTGRSLLGERA